MSFLDPPVTPYSSPADIREWLTRLSELAKEYERDATALKQITRARRQAEAWVRQHEATG